MIWSFQQTLRRNKCFPNRLNSYDAPITVSCTLTGGINRSSYCLPASGKANTGSPPKWPDNRSTY